MPTVDAYPSNVTGIPKGWSYLTSGLIHHVFVSSGAVYRIAKDAFPEYHDGHHFMTQQAAYALLASVGLRTPDIHEIGFNESMGRCYMIEERLWGKSRNKFSIRDCELNSIAATIRRVWELRLPGAGCLSKDGRGTVRDCRARYSELRDWMLIAYLDLPPGDRTLFDDAIPQLCGMMESLGDEGGRFLLMDPNPCNFFFDTNGQVCGMIDVDHPEVGDPVFDCGCISWHYPRLFRCVAQDLAPKQARRYRVAAAFYGVWNSLWAWTHKLSPSIPARVAKIAKQALRG